MAAELKGKPISGIIYEEIRSGVAELGVTPRLVIMQAGRDGAADYYIQNLQKLGAKCGLEVVLERYEEAVLASDFYRAIREHNADNATHGLMIQKPLPSQLDENLVNALIDPGKDVDGFHPVNLGRLLLDQPGFLPCTAAAVIEILKHYEYTTAGKNVVVVGRSNIVGKPLVNLLLRRGPYGDAAVCAVHSQVADLSRFTRMADILVAAVGRAGLINGEMIKPGAVLIDVGVNTVTKPDGSIGYVGDFAYEDCARNAAAITPVPGGVGTVTTALLLKQVFIAAKKASGQRN